MGKTKGANTAEQHIGKHPHVCGEDLVMLIENHWQEETPPRVWGRRGTYSIFAPHVGNTPTCVGKTSTAITPRPTIKKHPHVCGEDYFSMPTSGGHTETPPRVWGRLAENAHSKLWIRNTPTCVGKTGVWPQHRRVLQKHPHVCGEDE